MMKDAQTAYDPIRQDGIRLDHVSVLAPEGSWRKEPLLKDLQCQLKPHTITLIAGRTGSGKSTLLHTLAGLTAPHSGQITYGGQPLWQTKTRLNDTVHRSLGLVFQYPERQLFAETIRKEFRYSLRPYALSKAEQSARIGRALRRMELSDAMLEESFLTLSEGQKRKAALAATIAAEPQWLLLDEPTAGIDPQGIAPLLRMVQQQKNVPGGGAIVVSHDLDTFLPIADRVLLLYKGELAADGTPEELLAQPELWLRTEVGFPSALALLELRGKRAGGACFPLSAEAMSQQILQERRLLSGTPGPESTWDGGRGAAVKQEASPVNARCTPVANTRQAAEVRAAAYIASIHADRTGEPAAAAAAPSLEEYDTRSQGYGEDVCAPAAAAQTRQSYTAHAARQLNPIAKWIFYMLVSTGILLQHSWLGLGVSAAVSVLCMVLSGAPWRSLWKPAKPFMYFILISTLISGCAIDWTPDTWQPERLYFSLASAAQTLQLLSRFLLVMLLGVLLAVTTATRRMQAGLEQALAFLERFRIPVAAFTFSATLLLRFLPMIQQELNRTALIVQARGKTQPKRGLLRLREVPVFMIPFLLSMMKHAEDLSLALESRGYQFKRLNRDRSLALPWARSEWLITAAGCILLGLLYGLSR